MLRNIFSSFKRITYTPFNFYYSNKYLQAFQVPEVEYGLLFGGIDSCHTSKGIANYLKENLSILTDYHVSYAIFHMHNHQLETDAYFYNEIVPIIKEFVKNFDRECNKSLGELVKHLGWMKVNDDSLWQLLEQKLIKENLWRYIPLQELIECTHALAYSQKGTDEIFDKFENYIIKHRLNLTESQIQILQDVVRRREKSSKLFIQVLQNPKLDVIKDHKQAQLN